MGNGLGAWTSALCGRSKRGFCLMPLKQPSLGCYSHLGSKSEDGRFSLSFPSSSSLFVYLSLTLCRPAFQINKYIKKYMDQIDSLMAITSSILSNHYDEHLCVNHAGNCCNTDRRCWGKLAICPPESLQEHVEEDMLQTTLMVWVSLKSGKKQGRGHMVAMSLLWTYNSQHSKWDIDDVECHNQWCHSTNSYLYQC